MFFNTGTTCMETKGYLECSMTGETRGHQSMCVRGHHMCNMNKEIMGLFMRKHVNVYIKMEIRGYLKWNIHKETRGHLRS